MTRILLVDDDDVFRPALTKALAKLDYEVVTAVNGRSALEILVDERFDIVISDIRMPEVDGLELTKFIKENWKTPVILMTGFADILETRDAHQLGADEFIAKPFEREDISRAIESCLRPKSTTAEEEEFCKLGIDDFISGREVKYNIFVKLSETKFIKIAHQGEDISIDRIRSFKSKGVNFLYLRKSDFCSYLGMSIKLSKAAKKSDSIVKARRVNLLRHTGELLLERINHDGVNREIFEGAMSFVEMTVDLLTEDTDVFELLDLLNSHADHVYGHSVGVSLYGVMIARSLEWKMPSNNFKVAAGGLLHDIGKKEIAREILLKPRVAWNAEEVQAYESHCSRGVKILSQVESISEDVLRIVNEHHEDCHAHGFPAGLKRSAIHPMAKLVSVANEFCERVMKSPIHPGMHPQDAIRQMALLDSQRLEPQFFDALKKLFQPQAS